jgi:hypothetical protein
VPATDPLPWLADELPYTPPSPEAVPPGAATGAGRLNAAPGNAKPLSGRDDPTILVAGRVTLLFAVGGSSYPAARRRCPRRGECRSRRSILAEPCYSPLRGWPFAPGGPAGSSGIAAPSVHGAVTSAFRPDDAAAAPTPHDDDNANGLLQ